MFHNLWEVLFMILVLCVVYDQVRYSMKKGIIAGPRFKIPFVGSLHRTSPTFADYRAQWASGPLSCISIFHKFIVIAATPDLTRKTFRSPTYARPAVVDIAPKLLGRDHWVFLDGKPHTEFRKGLNPLFTWKALEQYLPNQEAVCGDYLERAVQRTKENWGKPTPFAAFFRDATCALMCRAFFGFYIADEAFSKISSNYHRIIAALDLVSFPFILPLTRAWYGKKAADEILLEFSNCAARSKVRMGAGGEVTCIMDAWISQMRKSEQWSKMQDQHEYTRGLSEPRPFVRMLGDVEIARTFLALLLAAQDTTSSAITWLFQVTAQHPHVLRRICEENLKARSDDAHASLVVGQLESLTYTRAVVRELLRYRPPAIVAPYEVKKPFPITEGYTVPKGSMLIPTIYTALRDPRVYENPEQFDPDRYYRGNLEEKGNKSYLVFGSGPHSCLGYNLAQLAMTLVIGKAAVLLNWKHHPSPLSEEIKVLTSILPMDDCQLTFEDKR